MTNILAAIIIVLLLTMLWGRTNRDDTDGPNERSGLVLYTDHKTGVQYVGTVFGALHVRVDRDGKPVIAKETND
jgi:hypothetical protein